MSNESPTPPSPAPAAPPPAPRPADPHLFDRLSILYKYRWASITIFVLVVGWVMVDSYTRIPEYRAQAQVLIEDPNTDIATPTEIARNVTLADPDIYMQTQLRIMRGRELAQRVAAKLDMQRVPEFNGQGPKPTRLAVGIAVVKYWAAWPYRLMTSSQAEPPAPTTSYAAVSESNYPDALLSRLNVAQIRGSQLVDMSFTATDPEFAARAANLFAEEYVASNLALKVQTLEKSAEWLTGEVEKQGKLVQESELKLTQYKERQDAGALDSSQNIVVARLTQSTEALTKARMDRIQKEGRWRQIQDAGQAIESITSVLNNTSIQTLRSTLNSLQQERARLSERYGEKHPDYQKNLSSITQTNNQLQAEIAKARQNAKNEYDQAVQQERELQGQLNEAKHAATALGRKGVDYAVYLREAESNRTIYNQLLTREKELRVVANSRTNNVRVVDRAEVPPLPFAPNHRRDWAYAIALGMALGMGIAFGIDYLDDTAKTPDDITRRLKLKCHR